jgi:cell division GTPase FtsZ
MPVVKYKTVVGVGQVGSRLAKLYAKKNDILLTFNTDHRDSAGIRLGNDRLITNGGAGQNYSRGMKIWAENREKLERYLEPVQDQDVVYFVASGGGSGSSSVITFLNILMKQNNRILLVAVAPFVKESIPATSNATRVLSRVAEFSNNMSVFIVSNDEIAKQLDTLSFDKVNEEIVKRVKIITDIVDFGDDSLFTPIAIDETDHRSVAYSGGFISLSDTNLEEDWEEKHGKQPKFTYGKLKEAVNVLITKNIDSRLDENKAMVESDRLVKIAMKIATSAKGARVLHGTIRSSDRDFPKYVTIASGLKIDKVFTKLKGKATDSALKYSEKLNTKETRKLEKSEDKILDI